MSALIGGDDDELFAAAEHGKECVRVAQISGVVEEVGGKKRGEMKLLNLKHTLKNTHDFKTASIKEESACEAGKRKSLRRPRTKPCAGRTRSRPRCDSAMARIKKKSEFDFRIINKCDWD